MGKIKKITFVGTVCSGKTTLLDKYRELFDSASFATFVSDAGRVFLTAHPRIDRTKANTHCQIQKLVLKQEQKAYKLGTTLIFCDGSVITAPAHVLAYGQYREAEYLLQQMKFWLPTYDKFFLLDPQDIRYEKDSIRRESKLTRNKLHKAFMKILTELNLPYEFLSGAVQERVKKINNILGLSRS